MTTSISKLFTNIETIANVLECIPVVGVITSGGRVAAGKVQTVAGIGIGCAGFLGSIVQPKKSKKWDKVTLIGVEQAIHGISNIFRGCVGVSVGLALGGFGSPLLLIPNVLFSSISNKPLFSPYVEYGFLAGKY